MKVTLIGVGLLGGSLGLDLRRRKLANRVTGYVRRGALTKGLLSGLATASLEGVSDILATGEQRAVDPHVDRRSRGSIELDHRADVQTENLGQRHLGATQFDRHLEFDVPQHCEAVERRARHLRRGGRRRGSSVGGAATVGDPEDHADRFRPLHHDRHQ